jgi:5-carboxymethyl-2-hydroxymuconate isomerase
VCYEIDNTINTQASFRDIQWLLMSKGISKESGIRMRCSALDEMNLRVRID